MNNANNILMEKSQLQQYKKDSERAIAEYRARQFTKKHFILGRLRQKGEEREIQLTSALLIIGLVLPPALYT